MRKVDAPRAGWYPDPQHSARLRWWDGLDWTDIRRAPPSEAELIAAEENQRFFDEARTANPMPQQSQQYSGGYSRQDAQEIIAEVRNVARQELDRAANEFSQRATTAVRGFTPLISDYTSQFFRWVKIALFVAAALFVFWLVFQAVASQSFFDWLGDRIDNLTDDVQSTGVMSSGAWHRMT